MPKAYGDEGELSHMLAYMRLEANNYRWRFNLVTGEVREGDIDDLNTEFNKTNPSLWRPEEPLCLPSIHSDP
jgi:carotenoid cleavage dioxygenase